MEIFTLRKTIVSRDEIFLTVTLNYKHYGYITTCHPRSTVTQITQEAE